MQKTLKLSVLDRVYTITTDEDEQCVLRAVQRVNTLLTPDVRGKDVDVSRPVVLSLLQLSLELEKALDVLQKTGNRIASLEKVLSESL